MTPEEFVALIDEKIVPPSEGQLEKFERAIGHTLPDDYRQFLVNCNGGVVRTNVAFVGTDQFGEATEGPSIFIVGGIREGWEFSLLAQRPFLREQIPESLLWIMGDGCGNAICIGLTGDLRGRVYFWDHDNEPFSDHWDGRVETAPHITQIANSFTEFVAGLRFFDDQ